MRYSAISSAAVLAVLLAGTALAAPPVPDPEPEPLPLPPRVSPKTEPTPIPLKAPKTIAQPKPEEVAQISKLMRDMGLQHMPTPLVKANDGWGKQKEYAVGKIILRDPKRVSPDLPREMVNDGLWRRFTVSARDPEKTFGVGITELVRPAEDKMLVTINVALEIDFKMEQQLWKRGIKLYSGETRGHCKTAVQLKATVDHKTEFKPGSFVPDVVLKITTTDAKIFYDDLVIDHTAGFDGEDAKAIGDMLIDFIKTAVPGLEKELLERGNAAIVKAAGTREVRLELDKLMKAGVLPKK
jgi:hypothetical protein